MRRLLLLLLVLALVAPAGAGAYSNGQLPSSALTPISHPSVKSQLANSSGAAWNTMRYCRITVHGKDIYAGGANSAYRRRGSQGDLRRGSYGSQWYFWELYQAGRGNLAARPGTSNHGWGNAVDLAAREMRSYVDSVGGKYGIKKVEAWSEWWHVNYVGNFKGPNPGTSQRYPILRKGSGYSCLKDAVKEVQTRLGGTPSGNFGSFLERRVKRFQESKGLKADGIVGEKTWIALRSTRGTGTVIKPPTETKRPTVGTDVRAAQGLLNARLREINSTTRLDVDGKYGPASTAAVTDFQAIRGITPDGRLGEKTWSELRVPARAPPLNAETLERVMRGLSDNRAEELMPHLGAAMFEGDITTPRRAHYFLSQLGHESVSLRYFEEIASGRAYEGRCSDLGNCFRGDGVKFKGHGPIQLTGRANHASFGVWAKNRGLVRSSRIFVDRPRLVVEPKWGFLAAVYYWQTRNLNAYSDRGDFLGLTKRINGGTNGYTDRKNRLAISRRIGDANLADVLTERERRLVNELSVLRREARAPKSTGWTGERKRRADEIKLWIVRDVDDLNALIKQGGDRVRWRQARVVVLKDYHGSIK